MTRRDAPPQVVFVYGGPGSWPQSVTVPGAAPREEMSGQESGAEILSGHGSARFPHAAHAAILGRARRDAVYDPHMVQRDFPERWRAYIRANFRDLAHVQQVFRVSEKTARNWWTGATGANGGHVAIAVREHPVAAPRMLFAAE